MNLALHTALPVIHTLDAASATALPPVNVAVALQLVVSVLLPLLVGRITRITTHPAIKSGLLLGFSVLAVSLTQLAQDLANPGYHFLWTQWVYQLIVAIIVAQGSHSMVWKPSGVTQTVQLAGDKELAADQAAGAALDMSTSATKPSESPVSAAAIIAANTPPAARADDAS